MKFNLLLLAAALVSANAHADGNYVCKDSLQSMNVTVSHQGTQVGLVVPESGLTAELSADQGPHRELPPELAGYQLFVGKFSDRSTSQGDTFDGAVPIESKLLNAGPKANPPRTVVGHIQIFSGEGFRVLECTQE